MKTIQALITEHIDIWTAAETEKKSGRGRASGNAGSVYGIKKLRELILELAVRGKLVPQDANDEPASGLLKRIQAEKSSRLRHPPFAKGGKTAAAALLTPPFAKGGLGGITEDEKPFELPNGWEWTTLAAISLVNPRNHADDDFLASFVPMTMIGSRFNSQHDQEPRLWKEIKQGFTHFAECDIGVAKITPCFENSKACVFSGLQNGIGAGTTELHVVRPINATLASRYILAYLKSPRFLLVGESRMTGTAGQKRLPKEFVESNPFPLPPLAEQYRIVAKVDELMALCDQLESQHIDAAEAHEKLVSHLLGTLLIPSQPPLLQRGGGEAGGDSNWQRIAAHFDTLFTTDASIDALKQTLLQLAVMGKLVPQDENDEPASELLKRIQAEKAKLIAEGKIKKDKPLPPITDDEKPFELPHGWEWVRLGASLDITGGVTLGRKLAGEDLVELPYLRVANVQRGYLILDSIKTVEIKQSELSRYQLFKDDLLVTEGGDWDKVGRTVIWNAEIETCLHQNHIFRMRRITQCMSSSWIEMYMNSIAKAYFQASSKQTTNLASINMTQLKNCLLAVPCVFEQHRIVAKVDELMALCDQLKSRITDASRLQQKLADVLVEQAVA
jgi:type I restriction enzyme S subunit